MESEESERSFEYTPTWVVAAVCFVIVFISVAAERGLHQLGLFFKRKKQKALFEALHKLKEELMLLGFISLLLAVFQCFIRRICIPSHLANIMLPCKLRTTDSHHRRLLAEQVADQCPEGNVPFLSSEALHQLHIFIFVLALVYVVFCAAIMVLGGIKIMEWGHWEHSITSETSGHWKAHTTHIHFQEFMGRAGKYWRRFHAVSWVVAFFKQFYGSVTKSDYVALRSGFIRQHCPNYPNYDFHKYMLRTLEQDFKKITGVSWYLWLFAVIFLLVNIAGWHAYFWLSFLPLGLLLIVGAKLEHIITELAKDALERVADAEGTTVRLSDELFWFGRPTLVLYLIHFILFQNSFEIAFFIWILVTYGIRSCIVEDLGFIIPRLIIGVIVQVLCSYSTLPLYALVTQMGSMFKQTVFNEFAQDSILTWVRNRRTGLTRASESMSNLIYESSNRPLCFAQQPVVDGEITTSEIELCTPNKSLMPSCSSISL